MADRANASEWHNRAWNQPAGRVANWIQKHEKSHSYLSKQAAITFWTELVNEFGADTAREMLQAEIGDIPEWLK